MPISANALLWGPRGRGADASAEHARLTLEGLGAVAAAVALIGFATMTNGVAPPLHNDSAPETVIEDHRAAAIARRAELAGQVRYRGGEKFFGAYGGAPYTYASDVHIAGPNANMTAHGIDWEGRPFESPIYYGVRIAKWFSGSSAGGMLDFTHSKVYSPMEQKIKLSGTRDGKPLPPEATIAETFHKLEFTHGHNMLTGNLMWRLPFVSAFVSPYVGAGVGVSLPHTEVQLKGDPGRTYEYQYTGPAAQVVAGIEIRLPRLSYFVEYKFTGANYTAPLQNRDGGWVIGDLIHQMQRWLSGKAPEGGWATTKLISHQVISGMGVRVGGAAAGVPGL